LNAKPRVCFSRAVERKGAVCCSFWSQPQGGGCGRLRHHPFNGAVAVTRILCAVGIVDARAQIGGVLADVDDGDVGVHLGNTDACSLRAQYIAEPSVRSSVPGSHEHLLTDADDPNRHPPAQGPVGSMDGDLEFAGRTQMPELFRRPRRRIGRAMRTHPLRVPHFPGLSGRRMLPDTGSWRDEHLWSSTNPTPGD
jgi:hypothetical protein